MSPTMLPEAVHEYYLALLQLHVAVVGVVVAGVVALVQMLNNAKPRRDVRLLARPEILVSYGLLLGGLLVFLAVGSWATAFPEQASRSFGFWLPDFFSGGFVGLVTVILMLLSLVWFMDLAFRTRALLDTQRYLRAYIQRLPVADVRNYLAAIHAEDGSVAQIPYDPFQPIREYVKDNAFKYYDYGTADGLRQFGALFDKALADSRRRRHTDTAEYTRLAHFISANCEELFRVFAKTSSEKRKLGTINLLYDKGVMLLDTGDSDSRANSGHNKPDGQGAHDRAHARHDASHTSLLVVVRGLEEIAKLSDDDDEIILAISRIRQLCDAFLDKHKKHHWEHVAGVFEGICLSVTRISEDYYLQKNNSLKAVPIIGYETGNHRTVTATLVDFFYAYHDLGDRYTDTIPQVYFAAIEGVVEVLFVRLGDIVESNQQYVGFTAKYHELARELYMIYDTFGYDAIEHHKPELLGLALSNLRRVIKPAKFHKLTDERQELCTMIVSMAAAGVAELGDVAIKPDGRTISMYTVEVLSKHATKAQITEALAALGDRKAIDDTDNAKASINFQSSAVRQFMRAVQALA